MNTYLVTGGAGFIGSNIVETLVKRGKKVKVIDNFVSGKRKNLSGLLDKIELIEGDIRDLPLLKNLSNNGRFFFSIFFLSGTTSSVCSSGRYFCIVFTLALLNARTLS